MEIWIQHRLVVKYQIIVEFHKINTEQCCMPYGFDKEILLMELPFR